MERVGGRLTEKKNFEHPKEGRLAESQHGRNDHGVQVFVVVHLASSTLPQPTSCTDGFCDGLEKGEVRKTNLPFDVKERSEEGWEL